MHHLFNELIFFIDSSGKNKAVGVYLCICVYLRTSADLDIVARREY